MAKPLTEAEWLSAVDPRPMLAFLRATNHVSPRKERLLACASCRRIWKLLVHEVSRRAVLDAERYADGLLEPPEREASFESAKGAWICLGDAYQSDPLDPSDEDEAAILCSGFHRLAVAVAAGAAACAMGGVEGDAQVSYAPDFAVAAAGWADVPDLASDRPESQLERAVAAERAAQAHLLRHLMGTPHRLLPALGHLPKAIRSLAEAVYQGDDLAFALADALCEAGFEEFAEHFRQQEHPKGCAWLDAILGKQ